VKQLREIVPILDDPKRYEPGDGASLGEVYAICESRTGTTTDTAPFWRWFYDFEGEWTTSVLVHVGTSGVITVARVERTNGTTVSIELQAPLHQKECPVCDAENRA